MKIPVLFHVSGVELGKVIEDLAEYAKNEIEKRKDENLALVYWNFLVKNDFFYAIGALGPDLQADRELARKSIDEVQKSIPDMLQGLQRFMEPGGACNHEDGFEQEGGRLVCKKCKQPLG